MTYLIDDLKEWAEFDLSSLAEAANASGDYRAYDEAVRDSDEQASDILSPLTGTLLALAELYPGWLHDLADKMPCHAADAAAGLAEAIYGDDVAKSVRKAHAESSDLADLHQHLPCAQKGRS